MEAVLILSLFGLLRQFWLVGLFGRLRGMRLGRFRLFLDGHAPPPERGPNTVFANRKKNFGHRARKRILSIAKTLSTAAIRHLRRPNRSSTKGALVHIHFPMMRRCSVHEAARRASVALGGAWKRKIISSHKNLLILNEFCLRSQARQRPFAHGTRFRSPAAFNTCLPAFGGDLPIWQREPQGRRVCCL